MKTTELAIAENAAAISDRVHSDRSRYQQLYDAMAQRLSGFPGIWNLIAECALELEHQHPGPWDGEWIETCWAIGERILALEELQSATEIVAATLKERSEHAGVTSSMIT